MDTKITGEILESYLNCKYKGYLKLIREQGNVSPYELLQKEARNHVQQAATHKLETRYQKSDTAYGVNLTLATLKRGISLLLDVTLEDQKLAVHFDALQKDIGSSRLGDFHYIPVLFHEAKKLNRQHKTLLAIHGCILGDIQGRQPQVGILIHGRECNTTKFKLDSGDKSARRALQQIKEIQETGVAPVLMLNRHCQICEFCQRCHVDATAKDDLSLLQGLSQKEIRKYNKRGILTVTQLSCTFRPQKRIKRSKQKSQLHNPALQALAIRDKKIYVLGTPELPHPSTQIYLDLEGDPERGYIYLLGMIIVKNGAEEHHSFWVDSQAEESHLFQKFLNVVNRLDDFYLYAYGSYEAVFLRRMIKELGQQELGEKILARVVNILSIIYSHIYFPTYSNRLKHIGGYLGFNWTEADASGIQSIVWRKEWEKTGSQALKEVLKIYNLEDCAALKKVTEFLYVICPEQTSATQPKTITHEGHPVSQVEEMSPDSSRPDWGRTQFTIPDFRVINKCAYFDYQRDKIFVRTNEALKKKRSKRHSRQGKKDILANNTIEISSQKCPRCRGTEITRQMDRRLVRLARNLKFTQGSIERWVTRFTTTRHCCLTCGKQFLPEEYLRSEEYFHSLKSWAIYEYVACRSSFSNIAKRFNDYFGLPVSTVDVFFFKQSLSKYYEKTSRQLLANMIGGNFLHVDETEVHLRHEGKGYVWVFTNMEEVLYIYRKSREGSFLNDMLKDFRGVLISDFYAPYDSIPCEQQKCLIHLIRDFNNDIQANPWDEELKNLASDFGKLLRKIIDTIDKQGLLKEHLGKHKRDVNQFFDNISGKIYRSEVTEEYRKKLVKYQDKLFTFLNHDGVPWNNNNAEHAIKHFAYYREVVDYQISESGLNSYLILLSLYITCKYKEVDFLKFLISQEKNIDRFCENPNKERILPQIELCPKGFIFSRRVRRKKKQTNNQDDFGNDIPVEKVISHAEKD